MLPVRCLPSLYMRSTNARLNAVDWAVRGCIALVFLLIGSEKFYDQGWVRLFAAIGFGQWFRYFTGSVQIAGALMLLIPRVARVGVAVLAATMLGAILVHVFILPTGISAALIPALLLGLISLGWAERGRHDPQSGLLALRETPEKSQR